MSLDVWLEVNTGGEYPAVVSESRNITHNVSGMFDAALKLANSRAVRNFEPTPEGRVSSAKLGLMMTPWGWRFYDVLAGCIRFLIDPDNPGVPGSKCGYSWTPGDRLAPQINSDRRFTAPWYPNPPRGDGMARVLAAMIFEMERNPDHFAAMNPDNGWGDSDGAKMFLEEFRGDCLQHPQAYVGMSA